LKKALVSRVEGLVKEVRAAPKATWALKPGADGDEAARKKLLEGITVKDVPGLVEKAKAQDSPLQSQGAEEQQGAVKGTLDEVTVTLRLLVARIEFLKNLAHIGKGKPDWGFGRVDAFGSVRALYFDPDYVPNAPVSYPHLFAFSRNPWFHYDGNTTSVLQRNLGQALGVGAIFEPTTFSSTLRPVDSNTLEGLAAKIKVPAWPADFFAPLDADKVAKGKAHFDKHCVSCHVLIKPTETAPDRLVELKAVGTDPQRATSVAAILPKTKSPFYDDLAIALNNVTTKALNDANIPPAEQDAFNHGRQVKWRTTQQYAARPLWGVWATAPYLHNGSVPTLFDLLLPAKERPKTFPLGHRDYDPVKVGYTTKLDRPRFTFDTSKVGNANSGHEFGTSLSEAERYELIEFLKSL
jgi:mono/diheme cytochrome c family protein